MPSCIKTVAAISSSSARFCGFLLRDWESTTVSRSLAIRSSIVHLTLQMALGLLPNAREIGDVFGRGEAFPSRRLERHQPSHPVAIYVDRSGIFQELAVEAAETAVHGG